MEKLYFASDYLEGCCERILKRFNETNYEHTVGYGWDPYSEHARELIKKECGLKDGDVWFLVGGTQSNQVVIDTLLTSYEGVLAASTGHVSVHEAGAIEFSGHKVLTLPQEEGKIKAIDIEKYVDDFYKDGNWDHMVKPGMVYISQPTEYGTIYSKKELEAISKVCREKKIYLFVDGARLAYALACPENDVTLKDLGRLCDCFYIGGTKCGALFGEAIVYPKRITPQFLTVQKQHGALLAKGRLLGIQFEEFFKDGLYYEVGKTAIELAGKIKKALKDRGYELVFDVPTNQLFFIIENSKLEKLSEKVNYAFGEVYDDTHSIIRFCTSWATKPEEADKLIEIIKEM